MITFSAVFLKDYEDIESVVSFDVDMLNRTQYSFISKQKVKPYTFVQTREYGHKILYVIKVHDKLYKYFNRKTGELQETEDVRCIPLKEITEITTDIQQINSDEILPF
jgi:hypothetical protein